MRGRGPWVCHAWRLVQEPDRAGGARLRGRVPTAAGPNSGGNTTLGGMLWDVFLAEMECLSKSTPYMTAAGNHDVCPSGIDIDGCGRLAPRTRPPALSLVLALALPLHLLPLMSVPVPVPLRGRANIHSASLVGFCCALAVTVVAAACVLARYTGWCGGDSGWECGAEYLARYRCAARVFPLL